MNKECWYRLIEHSHRNGGVNESGEYEFSGMRTVGIRVEAFDVIKHTPKGAWLDVHGEKRFVKTDARKRFACPTIDEAKQSFIARKKRQISILSSQLTTAKRALELANKGIIDQDTTTSLNYVWDRPGGLK